MVCKIAEMIYGIFLVVYRHISVVERLILMVAGLSPVVNRIPLVVYRL